ncbi:MAG: hypothetical protein FJ033_09640 [Chloroflexi bacterium]|nr:hypothetical protein [Chloroflexota bacterium]
MSVRHEFAIRSGFSAAEVQAHLVGCPACALWARSLRAVDDVARPALIVEPPPQLALRLAELAALTPIVRATPHRLGPE